ncbi:hypothetical protein VNO77_25002 [Canavalia gladiata]|uniref:Uncharacterized protein n=1 Tax=Canavalia gladiata TaxID=3824 RepID=A0AAN9L9V2_CANGL
MAGAIHTTKDQKVAIEQNQEDPTNLYYHFLFKVAIVLIFFVIVPLFPSQAPQFINQSLLTQNWELLHLLFVGVAISYGLFSRRNNGTEKDNNSKFDTAQSLVSRFLQVSSFFEDDVQTPSEFEETKVQTWSNQHYKNEPVVVVTPQIHHSEFNNHSDEKPLLLPVRSLKSTLCDDAGVGDGVLNVQPVVDESCTVTSFSLNRSTLTSKTSSQRFSNNSNKGTRNADFEDLVSQKLEDKMKKNVVLPSPIPWRSRSGKMDTFTHQSSIKESEFGEMESPLLKSQSSRSLRTSSLSPSSKFTSSSESLAKNAEEDLIKKKSFYKSCPPPPPPPPPMMFQKSISMKPRYVSFNERASFDKELKRSFTGERNNIKKSAREVMKPRGHVENMLMEKKYKKQEHSMQEPNSKEFGEEEKESFLDKVLVESDDDEDTETEDEDVGGGRIIENKKESAVVGGEGSRTDGDCFGSDEGPDVDKKADEFIAKFREQIRLQRIESIKRSTRTTRNSTR